MPVTGLRGRQILDGDVLRNDLNITTSGSAVIRRIIAGTNITISSTGVDTGTGDVTINASGGTGTVTSVGLSLPNIFSVTGSPVTTSGTLTATFASQTANTVFAAPNGSAGTPTFRSLVAADIPALTLENLPDAWVKRAVKCATTANITLSGTQTIDGIAVVAGDRVLVKNQSTGSQNGIYVVAAGAWTRSLDADASSELAGAMVAVDQGTTNGGTTWDTDFKSTDTIGTTANTWFRVVDTGYTIPVSQGGTGATTLTGILVGNGTSAVTAVTGTASQLLRRNSGNSAYEFFSAGNLTRTDDTNVTLTLGGTPTGALINAVSLTLGWSGQLAVGRGGTGASTLTGVVIGNGTSAMTAVAGTASQLLRRNAGNTAYEFFTHDFASTSGATFTGQIISTRANNTADGAGQIYLNGATGNRIDFNTAGVAAPTFTTRSTGTKIVLYPNVGASSVDYGIGIESGTLWFSIPTNTANSYKWYGGTTAQMELTNGNVRIGTGAAVGSGRLTVNASVGGTSLYLTDATNSTLIISHPALGVTRFTNGASVLWMQESGGNVSIGNSTSSVARLFVHNDNLLQPALFSQNQSTAATLQDTIPLKFTDLYNSGANGHNLFFNSSASSGVWEYNITKTYGGILTFGVSSAGASLTRQMYLYSSGQLRLANYTTTSSFTGTAVGVLAFTSDGSIITIATPGGGSGLTGSGTTNYISKFTSGTSLGNSLLFDNGTDIGINTATPTNTANYTSLHVNGTSGGIVRFSYAGTNAGTFYGSSAETAINAPSQINLYVANVQIANAQSGQFNTYETFYARKLGAQIQLAGGVATASGIFQAGNNLMYIADWATGANGLALDVSTGIFYTRSSQANGAYMIFTRSTSTPYGYIGNSAQLFGAGYNGNTELGIRSEGAINFATASGVAIARMNSTGQLKLPLYTSTTSFTGTAVGVLAFDSQGNILTIATPGGGGSSQWTTSGVNIYYTTGGVSIGTTTTSDILHIGRASGNNTYIRFDQLTRTTWKVGQAASTDPFQIVNESAGATRLSILASGQLILNAYTAYNSFSATDAQGILGFDTSGNIISMYAPIYRHEFLTNPVTASNIPANVSFFASSNAYVTKMDLTGKKRARLLGRVTTAANSTGVLRVRYATTFSTTASSYLQMGSSEIQIGLNTTGFFDSGWINLVAGAKADVFIALQTISGDGSADPVVAQVSFEAEE